MNYLFFASLISFSIIFIINANPKYNDFGVQIDIASYDDQSYNDQGPYSDDYGNDDGGATDDGADDSSTNVEVIIMTEERYLRGTFTN